MTRLRLALLGGLCLTLLGFTVLFSLV